MPTLAPKLPWTHAFAGGYPRLGGQLLPSDPDAIDYLARVAAADGAAVEVGVAMAVDQFVKGCKSDSAGYAGDPTRTVWDALKASCIMCGARTLAGALVPLKGASPTNVANNFASGDYDRSSGLKGDGATKYLDTNRASNADGQDDVHQSVYLSSADTRYASAVGMTYIGSSSPGSAISAGPYANILYVNNRSGSQAISGASASATGLLASSRSSSSSYSVRAGNANFSKEVASAVPGSGNAFVMADNASGSTLYHTNARLAFYSIGSAIPDLAALDTRVTQLVTGIKFHSLTGLVATDYDPDTVAYIVAAYESGGTL